MLAGTAVMGSGFLESSLEEGLRRRPHFIGCDAGSTDPGPSHLGAGEPAFPREAVKRDLRLMLLGARRLKVPLLIGSAGTAGGDVHLAWCYDILKEIAAAENLNFKLALIHAEQDKAYLKKRLAEGRIKPLHPRAGIRRRGDRPQRAHRRHDGRGAVHPRARGRRRRGHRGRLERHRDLRRAAGDARLSVGAWRGTPPKSSNAARRRWSTAKRRIACSHGCARTISSSKRPIRQLRCTPQSIASHSLYENADPFRLVECSGTLDLTDSRYEA